MQAKTDNWPANTVSPRTRTEQTEELLNKHAWHCLNEYAGIYKYRILTEYLSLHNCSVSEGLFPKRIDLGLVVKKTAQQQNLEQPGCDENNQVECWQEIYSFKVVFHDTAILQICHSDLVLQVSSLADIIFDLLQLGLKHGTKWDKCWRYTSTSRYISLIPKLNLIRPNGFTRDHYLNHDRKSVTLVLHRMSN